VLNRLIAPRGTLTARRIPVIERPAIRTFDDAVRHGTPLGLARLPRLIGRSAALRKATWQQENAENFRRSMTDQLLAERGELGNRLQAIGHLWLAHVRLDGNVDDLGLVSCRVVTDAGVQFIVDAFQNLVELENMKFHGLGTGTTAESAAQTALVTELTTQYSTSNTRPTGTLGEKSGDAKTYETTATITVSATVAATEHGIFSQAATGGGVILDRSVFAAVNLASGESLQATYQLTFPSGS
jgi:hypothetical protein